MLQQPALKNQRRLFPSVRALGLRGETVAAATGSKVRDGMVSSSRLSYFSVASNPDDRHPHDRGDCGYCALEGWVPFPAGESFGKVKKKIKSKAAQGGKNRERRWGWTG